MRGVFLLSGRKCGELQTKKYSFCIDVHRIEGVY